MTLRHKAVLVVGGATLVFLGCDYFNRLDALFCLVLLFIIVASVVRILAGSFSSRSAERRRILPDFQAALGMLALGGLYWAYLTGQWGLPNWAYRSTQRRMVLERVEAAGGWNAVHEGCQTLLSSNPDIYEWRLGNQQLLSVDSKTFGFLTNVGSQTVPIAIRKLSPSYIKFEFTPKVPGTTVLQVKMFGLLSSGGHSIPYYGLEVVLGSNVASYRPKKGVNTDIHSWSYRKVAEGVYEVY